MNLKQYNITKFTSNELLIVMQSNSFLCLYKIVINYIINKTKFVNPERKYFTIYSPIIPPVDSVFKPIFTEEIIHIII